MMNWLTDNWFLIIVAICAIAVTVRYFIVFCNKPTNEQLQQVREWLLYAVTKAEQDLGSKTGKLKLRTVYDMFLTKFSWIAKVMPFDIFSLLVDEALEEMRKMLKDNKTVEEIVEGRSEYVID